MLGGDDSAFVFFFFSLRPEMIRPMPMAMKSPPMIVGTIPSKVSEPVMMSADSSGASGLM